jgi:hypothetical protein
MEILTNIRSAKTKAAKNMKHPVEILEITAPKAITEHIIRAGSVEAMSFLEESKDLSVNVILKSD